MVDVVANDEQIETSKAALSRGAFLGMVDKALLVFSTLIINLFALAVPIVTLQIYDRILAFQSVSTLQVLCAGVFIIVILDIILRFSRSSIIGWTSARFEHMAYMDALKHIMHTKLRAYQQHSQGEMLHKLSAIAKLKSFYSGQLIINLIDMPFVLIFLGFIAYLSGWLVLVPIALLCAFGVFAIALGRSMKRALLLQDDDVDKRINFITEALEKIHTIKMLGLESAFCRNHESLQRQNILEAYTLNAENAQSYNASGLFTQIMMVSMIAIGALMTLNGQMTMGVLIACVLLSGRIMQPVQRALSYWLSYQEYQLAKDKIDDLLALPVQTKDAFMPHADNIGGNLDIKGLTFSYGQDTGTILDGVDFTLSAGKIISLGGPAGDGKTTLLKLIAGLYEADAGHVYVGGKDVSRIPSGDIARYVGYLPSDSEIFQGTILDNLTGFRPDKEDRALEMAAYLGIDVVVSKLAQGYQTVLFDGPADPLTPGLKQRITIARVLINRPRILLFDFADKSLDREGYNHLFRLLGQIKGQATMIIASNDRNLLHLAQEEYVLENGKLVLMDDSQYSKQANLEVSLKELKS